MQNQPQFMTLRQHLQSIIVGQPVLLDRLMIALLTGGHLLLEGPPGLAKTTAVKALAAGVHAGFQRIQFTPDLMPADITGSEVFDPRGGDFRFVAGPLFREIILADEINRAPPKVQSALLEAMEEHQVTVNGRSHALPELFVVMATQNPLEQAGTYPLPEAQLDRFLLHVLLAYPDAEQEYEILQRDRQRHFAMDPPAVATPLSPQTVLAARREVAQLHIEESVQRYMVAIVQSTRQPDSLGADWRDCVQYGASPRATLALARAASAHAYLQGRDYVLPDDVQEVAADVLRHRIILSFTARARQLSVEALLNGILAAVPVP